VEDAASLKRFLRRSRRAWAAAKAEPLDRTPLLAPAVRGNRIAGPFFGFVLLARDRAGAQTSSLQFSSTDFTFAVN